MTRTASAPARIFSFATLCLLSLALVSSGAAQTASNSLLFLFRPASTYGSATTDSIALGDLNGDGKADVVAGSCSDLSCNQTGSVSIFLGHGDGTFQPAMVYNSGGTGRNSVVLGDVNADKKLDVIVVNFGDEFDGGGTGQIGILLGNGDGTFQPVKTYATTASASMSVATADVNGDGRLDLLVANCTGNCSGSGSVSVLLGNGDGTFQSAVVYDIFGFETGSWSIATADLNGDGKSDLVVGARCGPVLNCGKLVAVLLGNGDGTFQSPMMFDSHEAVQSSVAVADVNHDGKPDLLAANLNSGTAGVLLGNGDGTFQPMVSYDAHAWDSPGSPLAITAADVDGDGNADLLIDGGVMGLLLNNGDGTFRPIENYNPSAGASFAAFIAVGDVNGDGKPDAAMLQADGFGVLLNNGGAPPTTVSLFASKNPVTLFQTVTYTAKVTPQSGGTANGTIVFTDGPYVVGVVPLSANRAQLKQTYNFIRTHSIVAAYSGDLNKNSASISKTLTEKMRINSTTTVFSSSLNPSIYGQAVTFSAMVTGRQSTPPTGKVIFTWSGHTIGSGTLNSSGVATLTKSNLNVGTYPLMAVYQGDALNLGSSSPISNQVVTQTTSAATIASSLNPSLLGQSVTFTAKITSPTVLPTGPVTFTAGTTVLGTAQLSGGKAMLTTSTLPAGSTVVKASYNGSSNIKGSSASVKQTVLP